MIGLRVLWLAAALLGAIPGQFEARLHHLHLTVPDPAASISAADAGVVAIAGGQRLEIVRDTARSGAGAYRLEVWLVTAIASHAPPGTAPRFAGLQLRVLDSEGALVTRFVTIHGHALHLFVISRDLEYFRYVHPHDLSATADLFDGTFEIPLSELPDLPPGPHMAIADVLPYGATPQTLHRAFVTPGYDGPGSSPPPMLEPGPAAAVADGVRVRIDAALRARKTGSLRFTFSDAATGAALTDLEPFLGAPAHLLIVSPDLTTAIHAHPEAQEAGGPEVSFEPLMPSPGVYKMWVQFQRRGKVNTASFVVRVN